MGVLTVHCYVCVVVAMFITHCYINVLFAIQTQTQTLQSTCVCISLSPSTYQDWLRHLSPDSCSLVLPQPLKHAIVSMPGSPIRLLSRGELNCFFSGVVSEEEALLLMRPWRRGDLKLLLVVVGAGELEVIDPVMEDAMLGGSDAGCVRSGVGLPVLTLFIIISSFCIKVTDSGLVASRNNKQKTQKLRCK